MKGKTGSKDTVHTHHSEVPPYLEGGLLALPIQTRPPATETSTSPMVVFPLLAPAAAAATAAEASWEERKASGRLDRFPFAVLQRERDFWRSWVSVSPRCSAGISY